jgi:hypothetical protein
LRPLIYEQEGVVKTATENANEDFLRSAVNADYYEANLTRLRDIHHSQCLFNRQQPVAFGLQWIFDDSGMFNGTCVCNEAHQGYDGMVHGGVIASIIDASMAQCLMGHDVVGYTVDLTIKYRKPV